LPGTVSGVLHGDLTGQNVMIDRHNGAWRLEGIIDFGDARVGHPLYDLATPAILIAGGDAELFSALLTGYGIPHVDRIPKLRDQLMANALLHPFGDITRCYAAMARPPKSLDEVAEAIFPF
jgi:hygromycin-B 7''-O-kinase